VSFRDWLDAKLYPDEFQRWESELLRERALDRIKRGMIVLDLGAGAGELRQMNFLGQGATICGVDPDPRVAQNRFLDDARLGTGDDIPYDEKTFDLVLSDGVLEHLEDPAAVFAEVKRVLQPGGSWLIKTPNRHHYAHFFTGCVPYSLRWWWSNRRGNGSAAHLRANTPEKLEEFARRSGLELLRTDLFEGSPAKRGFWLTYLAGWLYERVVNSSPRFERYRGVLVAELRSPLPVKLGRGSSSRDGRATVVA